MQCILCKRDTEFFREAREIKYYQCKNCGSVQMDPQFYISANAEEERYLTHNNDVEDPRYQNFVSPITSRILKDFNSSQTGLDYGCGTGPVAASELGKKGYKVALYDPYFKPEKSSLRKNYDFIICCEVMEHFYNPYEEFQRFYNLLNPGGKLYCKTSLFSEAVNFDKWYYKDDPTHVFFYTEESLKWIKEEFNFKKLEVFPKVIVFSK